ncbi:unnamed protein product, partial [Ixodes persulcatus]
MWRNHASSREPMNDPNLNTATSPVQNAPPSDDCALTSLYLQCPVPADKLDLGFAGGLPEFPTLPPSAIVPECSVQPDHGLACNSPAKTTPPPSVDIPKRPDRETLPT